MLWTAAPTSAAAVKSKIPTSRRANEAAFTKTAETKYWNAYITMQPAICFPAGRKMDRQTFHRLIHRSTRNSFHNSIADTKSSRSHNNQNTSITATQNQQQPLKPRKNTKQQKQHQKPQQYIEATRPIRHIKIQSPLHPPLPPSSAATPSVQRLASTDSPKNVTSLSARLPDPQPLW